MSLHITYDEKERTNLTPAFEFGEKPAGFSSEARRRPVGLSSATGAAYMPGPVSPSTVFFNSVTVDRHDAVRPDRREIEPPLARPVRLSMSGERGFREVPGGSLRRFDLDGDDCCLLQDRLQHFRPMPFRRPVHARHLDE